MDKQAEEWTDEQTDRQKNGRTDGQTDMKMLIFAAGNFAKVLKKNINLPPFVHTSEGVHVRRWGS
jgi:hypothetical protein